LNVHNLREVQYFLALISAALTRSSCAPWKPSGEANYSLERAFPQTSILLTLLLTLVSAALTRSSCAPWKPSGEANYSLERAFPQTSILLTRLLTLVSAALTRSSCAPWKPSGEANYSLERAFPQTSSTSHNTFDTRRCTHSQFLCSFMHAPRPLQRWGHSLGSARGEGTGATSWYSWGRNCVTSWFHLAGYRGPARVKK